MACYNLRQIRNMDGIKGSSDVVSFDLMGVLVESYQGRPSAAGGIA